jgi:hypothetical protein
MGDAPSIATPKAHPGRTADQPWLGQTDIDYFDRSASAMGVRTTGQARASSGGWPRG